MGEKPYFFLSYESEVGHMKVNSLNLGFSVSKILIIFFWGGGAIVFVDMNQLSKRRKSIRVRKVREEENGEKLDISTI